MTVKSSLQVILFLLIFLIIGGIYILYFYPGSFQNEILVNKNIENENLDIIDQNISIEKEILDMNTDEDEKIKKVEPSEDNLNQNNKQLSENPLKEGSKNYKNKNKENNNLTKEIEYVTTNSKGEIFKIFADYGITNLKDTNILDLENVDGIISSPNRSKIFITSDFAKYNYTTQNSKFYNNVVVKFDQKIITCDNLELKITEDLAIAYDNVIVKDSISFMKAQNITMDIITKNIKINSKDKVEILTN